MNLDGSCSGMTPVAFGDDMVAHTIPATGEGVLWLHGYTMDSTLWKPLWGRLRGWRHIGVDWPGHGLSPAARKRYSLPTLAHAIGQTALLFEVRHIIGLSFGAILALQIATEFPNSFETLILGSAGLAGGAEVAFGRQKLAELAAIHRLCGPGPWMADLWVREPPQIFTGAKKCPHLWQALRDVVENHKWTEFENGLMNDLSSYSQVENLERLAVIQSVTLIVVGEHEMSEFLDAAELIQRAIRQCERVTIPGRGHLCMLEAPIETASIIEDHLMRHRAEGTESQCL